MNRLLVAAITFTLLIIAAPVATVADSVDAIIYTGLKHRNDYAAYPIPPRETLLAHAPYWKTTLRRRQRDGPQPSDCGRELTALKEGFIALYPEAPNPFYESGLSWTVHVETIHFPELLLCDIRYRLNMALADKQSRGLKFPLLPQRINVITHDFSQYSKEPRPIQKIRWALSYLIRMSHKGYAPAMLELVRLGARDDIIRLTPRFTYYLLSVCDRAGLRDPIIQRMLAAVRLHLSKDDRARIDARIPSRQWPRSERMVID